MNTTSSGRLTYKEACTVGSATAAGKRKEAKQKRRALKTREAEEEQARVESARKVRREAKRAKREETREEKRASADSAVVADLQYDALDDELDATKAEVMRRSATAADGDEFAQRYATAAEADANSAAEVGG